MMQHPTPTPAASRERRLDLLTAALAGPPAQRSALRAVISGVRSRTGIARETGLDTGTITRAVAALIDGGILIETNETGTTRPGRGRPTRLLAVEEEQHWAVGLHVGVRGVVASAIGLGGSSLASIVCHHDGSQQSALDACLRGVTAMREAMPTEPLGIGVAVGGRVDPASGRILSMPRLGWRDVPLAELLTAATGLPCAVQSMAQAQARANVVYGQVGAKESFGHLYVGYIVEYCVVIGGEVWAPEQRYGGAIDSLILRAEDDGLGTVRDLVSDDGILAQARRAGLVDQDADFDTVIAEASAESDRGAAITALLERRAGLVGDLITQLQEVIALPTVVVSASIARQPGALDIVHRRLAEHDSDRTPPRILSGGPVDVVNPRSGACGFFEKLFQEAEA